MHPEHLYHYTSIKTLALILSNRKIKFNRLDKVDDLLEAKSSDFGNLGRLFFVSCWSSSAEENIPLWSMYTPGMAGVRIKLPAKMFKKFIIKPQLDGLFRVTSEIESPVPYERFLTDQYMLNPTIYNFSQFLKKVEYTNSEDKLYPKIFSAQGGKNTYSINDFGKSKRLEWEFQLEWRFIMFIWPGPFSSKNSPVSQSMINFSQELESGLLKRSLPFDEFFLDLGQNIIDNIEVLLGPKASDGDQVIVESLISKYCSNGKIKSSNLKIR